MGLIHGKFVKDLQERSIPFERITWGALALRLRLNKSLILKTWEDQARQITPSAIIPARPLLLDALPLMLERLSATLEGELTPESPESERGGQEHGGQRAGIHGYSLERVLSEIFLLRKIIFKSLEQPGEPVRTVEREMILEVFDTLIRESATEFVRIQYERIAADQAKLESLQRESETREKSVSILVHDLRNPLTAARTGMELIEQLDQKPEKRTWLIGKILSSINRVDQMVRELLDASRNRSGTPLLLRWEVCDLNVIVQGLLRDLAVVYGNSFVLNVSGETKGFWATEGLRRAIENLLNNAIKYGSNGTPVTVTISKSVEKVTIEVHNEGNPLSQEEQAGLFQPFGRTRSALESGKRGWGLGLSMVKAVAEAHQGSISVESSPERGTTFRMIVSRSCAPGSAQAM